MTKTAKASAETKPDKTKPPEPMEPSLPIVAQEHVKQEVVVDLKAIYTRRMTEPRTTLSSSIPTWPKKATPPTKRNRTMVATTMRTARMSCQNRKSSFEAVYPDPVFVI